MNIADLHERLAKLTRDNNRLRELVKDIEDALLNSTENEDMAYEYGMHTEETAITHALWLIANYREEEE